MKHFLVEISFTAEPQRIAAVRPEHRVYLQAGLTRGLILFSGLQKTMTGGVVVAKAESQSEIERFFASDPYRVKGLATYRFVEFEPVFRQSFLENWMKT